MATKRPLTRIGNGRRGRPPEVRNVAVIAAGNVILAQLIAEGVLPAAMPLSKTRPACERAARAAIEALAELRDLHLVPGPTVRELAIIVGEAGPKEPTPQEPTPQEPNNEPTHDSAKD